MSRVILADQDYGSAARILNLPDASDPQEPATLAQLLAAASAPLYKLLTADGNLVNDANPQPWFASSGAVAVEAATLYWMRGRVHVTKNTTASLGFSFGGTASLSGVWYRVLSRVGLIVTTGTGPAAGLVETASNTLVVQSTTGTATDLWVDIDGHILINGAGTIIPQLTFSAAPGASQFIKAGAAFSLIKLPSNPSGTWS